MAKIKKAKAQEPFSMHTYIGESASAVKASLHFFKTYPISILPLMLCWVVYASIILYFKYGFNFEGYSAGAIFLMAFGVYVLFSLIYGLACLILLEMAQQVSQDEKVSLGRAVKDAIVRDLLKSVPILLVWAVVWFVLVILQVLFSKKSKNSTSKELTPREAVGTLLGEGKSFGSLKAFFQAISKAVRMVVFLILPGVAWEDLSPVSAFKKGMRILRNSKVEFAFAYGATGTFAAAVMLIPAIIYYADSKLMLNLPEVFWVVMLIYMAFATSLSLMVEQLYVAELYLWHMRRENNKKAKKA